MKSRIVIDINEENRPVVVIDCVDSEDLRDKTVLRFLQSFGGCSFAKFKFDNSFTRNHGEPVNRKAIISPLNENDFKEEQRAHDAVEAMGAPVETVEEVVGRSLHIKFEFSKRLLDGGFEISCIPEWGNCFQYVVHARDEWEQGEFERYSERELVNHAVWQILRSAIYREVAAATATKAGKN